MLNRSKNMKAGGSLEIVFSGDWGLNGCAQSIQIPIITLNQTFVMI